MLRSAAKTAVVAAAAAFAAAALIAGPGSAAGTAQPGSAAPVVTTLADGAPTTVAVPPVTVSPQEAIWG